ncbi:MAG: DUF3822 family protein [Bacteroidales bacterium]
MDSVFIDETFDLNQTGNYHISIQAGLDGYSFSVLDPVRNKYILLKHYKLSEISDITLLEDKIHEIQKNDEFLSREYKSALFSYQSPKYTIIPGPLFNKQNLRSYFEFNQHLDDLDEIHYNKLNNTDAYNLYIIPSRLACLVKKAFDNVRYYHQVTPFIENGLMQYGGKTFRRSVLVNLYGKYADVIVVQGEKLILSNTFPWKTDQDLVYFILYVYEQLKLSGEDVPLVISGSIKKRSEAYELLKVYIKKVGFESRNDTFQYSYTLNDIDLHWFTNLFNLKLCV